MVKVKALQRVYEAGKEYAPGDEFDVPEKRAVLLGAIRKVMRAETAPQQPQQPEPEATPTEEPPKGRLRRRDLKAED